MDAYDIAWHWLADSAVGGLIVLVAGSVAARFCCQPAQRARVVVLTLMAALGVPIPFSNVFENLLLGLDSSWLWHYFTNELNNQLVQYGCKPTRSAPSFPLLPILRGGRSWPDSPRARRR